MAVQIGEDAARFLVSEAGRALLEQIPTLAADPADQVLALRKRGVAPEIALPAVEVASARRRARFRFADADHLFFTGDGLAQATSPAIAAYHATCLAPLGTVLEIGCGIGMDTVAFAAAGLTVTAIERDQARLIFAQANAQARGVAERIRFLQEDVSDGTNAEDSNVPTLEAIRALVPEYAGLYADPSRREGDRRTSQNVLRYDPPLPFLAAQVALLAGSCIKLSPALPDDVLEDFARSVDGRIEFLSENRECKEACILSGEARGAGGNQLRTAVLLPERIAVTAAQVAPVAMDLPVPGAFALDPDPALIRADALGAIAGASLISPDDAYLQSDAPPDVPRLASAYRIEVVLPYHARRLGEWLKSAGYGRLVVKKRHFLKEPAELARDLKLPGTGREITLILVRTASSHLATLCHPV